jgi:hypothetical protein
MPAAIQQHFLLEGVVRFFPILSPNGQQHKIFQPGGNKAIRELGRLPLTQIALNLTNPFVTHHLDPSSSHYGSNRVGGADTIGKRRPG